MFRPRFPSAIGCPQGLFRRLGPVLVALSLPLSLPAQNAELLPVESQFLAPLMNELNQRPDSSHPEMEQRVSVRYELVSRTDSGHPAEIVAESRGGFIGYKLRIARASSDRPLSYLKEIVILSVLTGTGFFRNYGPPLSAVESFIFAKGSEDSKTKQAYEPFEMAETLTNMKEGSLSAHLAWETHVLTWLKSVRPSGLVMSFLQNWTPVSEQEIERTLTAESERLEKDVLPRLRERAARDSSRKSREWERLHSEELKALEERDLKLNDLIVRNDRAGVRRLIEAYLPWSLMEPVEQRLWRHWLEAIEFPDPSKKTVVFRGVNYLTDFVQTLKTPDGPRLGFMSTLLTKNQGNYTRRLRSLRTRRAETGDFISGRWRLAPHVKVSEQMKAHAIDPKSSQFLSFTMDPAVIKIFVGDVRYDKFGQEKAGGGFLAVSIDSRRLFPNLRNGVTAEMEYLAPLVVFPDEIVEYREVDVQNRSDREVVFNEFLDSVRKKIGNAFQTHPMKDAKSRIRFFSEGKSFTRLFFEEPPGRSCRHVWN